MDSLLATLVFVLPGFMAYFWIQVFGKNPVQKHTPMEFTAISALVWLPVSYLSLRTYNWLICINFINNQEVWTVNDLKVVSSDFTFLFEFLLISAIVSLIISILWVRLFGAFVDWVVNKVRKWNKIAPLSPSASVWEEFFIRFGSKEDKDKELLLKVYKIDKPDEFVVGSMIRASRPLESDKAIVLDSVGKWEEVLKHYDYTEKSAYIDVKTGLIFKELDHKNPILKKPNSADESNKKESDSDPTPNEQNKDTDNESH